MIIRPEEDTKHSNDVPYQSMANREDEESPPPQYEELVSPSSASHSHSHASSISSSSSFSTPDDGDGRAVNYIAINKPLGSIDCKYVLDPAIQIPTSFLPKLGPGQTEEDRKNLSLKTKVGTVVAEIMLQHREGSVLKRRTLLECKTTVGTMILKVDATPSPNRPPFQLKATTQSGTVLLYLPTSFRGFLTVTTTIGTVSLSREVIAVNRWLSTTGRVRKAFIGDASQLRDSELEAWNGDEVIIETTVGSVEIAYVEPGAVSTTPIPAIASPPQVSAASRIRDARSFRRAARAAESGPPPLMTLLGYQNPLGK
ncbi:hypothetical protein V5O48_016970 [Marasmius crinis-equi]|uniref:DUF7330 domain-containing protein n=1 Tax=Marasmius crinis-equi TaxID=585013 RepID=A0ABR3EQH9_9AGAR